MVEIADEVVSPGDEVRDVPKVGVSRWAIAALGTSMAFVCPLLTLIGPLLAVRALVEIKANPGKTGRGMAIAALWIGVLAAVGWIAFMFWWNANVRAFLIHGPQDAIVAGMRGNASAFRDQFIGDGTGGSDAAIASFAGELRSRYGEFQLARQDSQAAAPDQTGDASVMIPYELLFERGAAKADVRIRLFARGLVPRLESITVKDAQKAPLTYP
jgi:hypothetical protein